MSANQMFVNRLNPVKSWPSQYALDKHNEVAATETGLKAGRVMHIDPTTGKFKEGLPGNFMPIYAWNAFGDLDTVGATQGYNMSEYGTGKGLSGLVATGAYELQSTEYAAGETYAPNTPLTTVSDTDGHLTPGAFYTDVICGIVSDGVLTNPHGVGVVQFWSYFLPSN